MLTKTKKSSRIQLEFEQSIIEKIIILEPEENTFNKDLCWLKSKLKKLTRKQNGLIKAILSFRSGPTTETLEKKSIPDLKKIINSYSN
jgi:hypothetical protein